MANNAVVGTLRALLTADTAQFESGMRRASVVTGNFGKTTKTTEADAAALTGKMAALGAVAGTIAASVGIQATRALVAFGKEAVNSAGHLVDLREKTGESLTSLQRMQHVADQTGTSLDAMTNAAFMLRTRLAGGGNSVNKALEDLRVVSGQAGLSVRSSADEILSALSRVQDEQERTRLGNLLFGRSFRELAGAVTSGYDEIADKAKVSSDAQIQALSDAGDAWDAFVRDRKTQFRSLLGEMVINARELARIFSDQGLFGGGAVGAMIEFRRRQQMGLVGGRQTDIPLTTNALRDLNTQTRVTAVETDKAAEAWARFSESVRGATFGVQVMLRDLKVMPPAIDSMNVSLEDAVTQLDSYSAEWRDTRITMDGLITAVPTLGAKIDETTTIVEDASQSVVEFRSAWDDLVAGIGERLTQSISDSFGDMLVGLRSFKDGFLNIWRSIQQALSNILSAMLQDFVGGFLSGMLRALGAARLGQAIGNAVMGSAAGAAVGGGAAAAAGTGAGAGGGAGLAALATNPFTIAAAGGVALGLAIWRGGLFRGGEEALHVNPRRDQFIAQFGSHHGLAARLTAAGAGHGGGALLAALNVADTVKEFEAAQSAIAGFLGKDVRLFNLGGFIPPGVVQPAILHGGTHGEVVTPLGRGGAPMIVNINANIKAWDVRDVKAAFRDQIIPETKQALLLNTDGLTTAIQRHALGGRR